MRALRIGLTVLFVLAVLFVAADRVSVKLAEDKAAEQIKKASGVPASAHASVDIKGFPFLTQVAGRELDEVDGDLSGIRTEAADQQLTVTRISAELHDVHIRGDYSSAVAERANGTALVSYADLTKAAPSGVRVSWGGKDDQGKGRVKVSGGISLLGHTFQRSVTSTVHVSGDTVKLHAVKVPGAGVPGLDHLIRNKIDFARRIGGLPSGLALDRVAATKKGVEVSVRGKNVEISH